MSMIATIYRIPEEIFEQLAAWDWETTKSTEEFISSFMGLEYLLSVGADEHSLPLYQSIFNPTSFIGPPDWQSLSFEQQMELYADRKMIFYLDPARIAAIDRLLENVTESQFSERFNADELNGNDIYPLAWNNNEGPDVAFNRNHLLRDLAKLKGIFRAAAAEGDYLVVYTG